LKLLNCSVGFVAKVNEAEFIALFPLHYKSFTSLHILFRIEGVEVYLKVIS